MRLACRLIPRWPKLAWAARFPKGADEVEVLHGPMVETRPEWCVEAVWAGDFDKGDFDRTDLIFGSGIRCRGDKVVFVTSGTVTDRLWYTHQAGLWVVSNSLPALLAIAHVSLCEDYSGYANDMASVDRAGLRRYVREVPSRPALTRILYFSNLCFDGRDLEAIEKPDVMPPIKTFTDYYAFLTDTAGRLKANLSSPDRRNRIVPLVGVSSGYDSAATAVIARHAGCTRAVTIANSTSFWRGSDSGAEIARRLGLRCRAYTNSPAHYRDELTVWAAAGRSGGLNMTVFDYPEPLCLLFTGNFGDKIWDRAYHDLSNPTGDFDAFLGEFRLAQGMFHCVVPWWGIRHAQEIHATGLREDMKPWTLNTDYDRPIARRLVEEAGVPRAAFGVRKRNTSVNAPFAWPYSPESQASLRRYLRERGRRALSPSVVRLARRVAHLEFLFYWNVQLKFGLVKRFRPWYSPGARSLLFRWANSELKSQYERAMHHDAQCAKEGRPQ
jgi:hypothetical protein